MYKIPIVDKLARYLETVDAPLAVRRQFILDTILAAEIDLVPYRRVEEPSIAKRISSWLCCYVEMISSRSQKQMLDRADKYLVSSRKMRALP